VYKRIFYLLHGTHCKCQAKWVLKFVRAFKIRGFDTSLGRKSQGGGRRISYGYTLRKVQYHAMYGVYMYDAHGHGINLE
jgi:hypothetical protein